jgi:hypothetical protein
MATARLSSRVPQIHLLGCRFGRDGRVPGEAWNREASRALFQMDKDDADLMVERKKRMKRIGSLDARLRAHFSELTAMAPARDYDNLLAQAFSGQERYRPEPISENELGGGRTDEV